MAPAVAGARAVRADDGSHFLVVEGDAGYAAAIRSYMGGHGIAVSVVSRLVDALDAIVRHRPRAMIMDQYLAGHDLAGDLPSLRRAFSGPLIMLAPKADPFDSVVCLEAGADDFVLKSIDPRELLARLRAVIRRAERDLVDTVLPGMPVAAIETQTCDGWLLHRGARTLTNPAGEGAMLTRNEMEMLWLLTANKNRTVGRTAASEVVLHRDYSAASRRIDNLVCLCRRRVRALGGVLRVVSKRGEGYVLYGIGPESRRPAAIDG